MWEENTNAEESAGKGLTPDQATQIVAKIVEEEFADILQKTSASFQNEMKALVIRTLWDSENSDRYGEYYGVPATSWAPNSNGRLPPEIVIFARHLVGHYGFGEGLRKKTRKVVLHEIGHHLGLSEIELRERGIF